MPMRPPRHIPPGTLPRAAQSRQYEERRAPCHAKLDAEARKAGQGVGGYFISHAHSSTPSSPGAVFHHGIAGVKMARKFRG